MIFGALLAVVYFVTLPSPPLNEPPERQIAIREWHRSLVEPVLVATLVNLPVVVATARFASTWPRRPLNFVKSLLITATTAGIAHSWTVPLKGPADNTLIVLTCVVGSAVLLVVWGSRSKVE